jgi:hypothetical protein
MEGNRHKVGIGTKLLHTLTGLHLGRTTCRERIPHLRDKPIALLGTLTLSTEDSRHRTGLSTKEAIEEETDNSLQFSRATVSNFVILFCLGMGDSRDSARNFNFA